MAIFLGLLVVCLGAYFLHIFFQMSRLEKALTETVNELETFLKLRYGITEKPIATENQEDKK